MSSNTKEDLLLKYFIFEQRKRNRKTLYEPKFRCGPDNFIHSDYVYMRSFINVEDNLMIQSHDAPPCNVENQGSPERDNMPPCIRLASLNSLIKEDNKLLEDWAKQIQSQVTKQKKSLDSALSQGADAKQFLKKMGFNPEYSENFLMQINEAINSYKNVKYTKNSFVNKPYKCMSINIAAFFNKYVKIINSISNTKNLTYYEPSDYDFGFFDSRPSDVGISSQELKNSKKLLQKICSTDTTSGTVVSIVLALATTYFRLPVHEHFRFWKCHNCNHVSSNECDGHDRVLQTETLVCGA